MFLCYFYFVLRLNSNLIIIQIKLYFKKQTIDIQIGKITMQITRQTRIKKQTIHDVEN